ncbi:HAMP domain-containing histidine kinase [candidate division WWE3 bacterium]|uniref:histidine kinase n=1 Tax=candidate division WWE3 bacterium TaxID=2053526 RepID=A0A7X9E739_UNCKA|nr:HAMP domain-containing histidine kinase [candidate division WWE3 bacterium]
MQVYILNILVIVESILLLITSLILFSKTRNLTNLKKYEEALINAQAEQQAKENDFFPMLVHELRAPLSVIQGAADLLIKSTEDLNAEQIHTLLNQIKISSSSLLEMVGEILDVSKMEGGKFQINKTYGSIEDVLKEQCSYFEPVAKVRKVTLSCPKLEDLPSFSFDPERIKQVLNNLISNAIKFSLEGGSIVITSKKDYGFVRIEVVDNGVGVADKDKPLLFQKFFQASNHKDIKEKGTGLGLVIAKGIVEAHGGKIWVEDNKPKGSKFIFTIPLR